jgi:hypothetical protein
MAPRSVARASRSRNPAAAGAEAQPVGQNLPQGEQEVSQNWGENQGGEQLPPPPPLGDLAQIIHNQTLILETLANALVNRQPRGQSMNDKLTAFLRTKPPTFAGSCNPLDADDWLRVIQRKLEPFECQDRDKVLLAAHQLTRTALSWWENYCAAAEDASTISWEEFVKEFRWYHIPSATMKCKADEFRALQQGSMTVEEYTHRFIELSRYAPEEVNDDDKKQDMFKKGLNPELRTLLTPQIYPDFNTLMNKAILTERAKTEERKDNKRKFLESKARQQDRFQKPRSFSYTAPRSQAPMQYRTQSQVTGPRAPDTHPRSQNTMRAPQSNASLVASDNSNVRACFNCRETGHFIANCPYAKNKPATSAFSNTVNGPRPALTGANRVPIRNNDNSQQMKQPQQSFGRARVNHIDAQEAQEAQGIVLGEYLVNSALATVLFDSGASHSFISSSFVEKHKIPTVLLKTPLLTRTPGGDINCQLGCPRVRINLSGVEFLAKLVVLQSGGIDVILGMDWLSRHNGLIGCTNKVVHLTNSEGVRVICHTRESGINPMMFSMEAKPLERVLVVNDTQMSSPKNYPVCHRTGT